MARLKTTKDKKLEALRDQLWPGCQSRIWKSAGEKGYFCAPRVLPLLLHLMREKNVVELRTAGDCGQVYLELLARDRGQGIVEIGNEGEHASLSGYPGKRGIRTWKERIKALEKAGFIEIQRKGSQDLGAVLIVHPHIAVSKLRSQGKISESWWRHYQELSLEYGCSQPTEDQPASGLMVVARNTPLENTPKRRMTRGT